MRHHDCWPGSWDSRSGDVSIWSPSPQPTHYLDWDDCADWRGRPPFPPPWQPWPPRPPRPPRPPYDPCDCTCPPPCPPPCPPEPCPCPPPRPRRRVCRRELTLSIPECDVRCVKCCQVSIVDVRAVEQGCHCCIETEFCVELEVIDGCGCCRRVTHRAGALCCGFPPHILCVEPQVAICGRLHTRCHCGGLEIYVPVKICF